jgi:HEAT repeat-containing protein 5
MNIYTYSTAELLKEEKSEVDLAGPTLQSLKSMLENYPGKGDESLGRYSQLVHGLFSACLVNVDEMR